MEQTKEIHDYISIRNKRIVLEYANRFKSVKEALKIFHVPKRHFINGRMHSSKMGKMVY